jgi:hypothetical protein
MRATAVALIASIFVLGVPTAHAQPSEATAWRQVAETIPLGSKVKVQIADGKRLNGTLMGVDATALMLKRNTRRPEPALMITFDEIAKLERDQPGGGVQIAKAIGVGLAAGAGVFFSLILIALQMD